MADWRTHTHTLIKPITLDGASVTTVTLREPDAEALELLEESGIFVIPDDAPTALDPADFAAPAPDPLAAKAQSARKITMKQTRQMVEALIQGDRRIAAKLSVRDLTALAEAAGPLVEEAMGSPD